MLTIIVYIIVYLYPNINALLNNMYNVYHSKQLFVFV